MIGSQLNGAPRRPGLLATLWAWSEIRRQRRHLGRLSAHELKDIGISRLEADAEARRPFWDTARARASTASTGRTFPSVCAG